MQTLYAVKDYDRIKAEYIDIIAEGHCPDGTPNGNSPGDPTGQKAVRALSVSAEIEQIERALEELPLEYRKGVFDNIRYGGWPVDPPAHYKTWLRWRQRFLFQVAKNKKII